MFRDVFAETTPDPDHSADERREIIIGISGDERLVVVSFTERAYTMVKTVIRIISAREATAHERRKYEEDDNNPLKRKR